ncbi:MAG TPA: ABC transporter substrate-binding protein [Solirubrobacteraceae bacterium]|nr:ABC transporter substrate-binding protein [Solirubrobacteraceae bacterium]
MRKLDWALGAVLALMVVGASACGSSSSSKSTASNLPQKVGAGEGALNLIAWEGYAQPEWVKPFEKSSGCVVHAKYAGSSDEMVTLMRQSGSQYDMVSASGDASLRLIDGGDVAAMNVALVPEWKNFIPQLQSPVHNTVNGVHYGISLQWGPNTLLYNTKSVTPAPTSWAEIYGSKYKGLVSVPNNPIQIADAALYLSKTEPSLGISDPYELTEKQLDAAVELLKKQRPLIKKYWSLASDEIELFKSGDAVIGAAWPYQYSTLIADHVPVQQIIPSEGATGWADTWMLSAHAKHPNCAYKWVNWVSSPKVQAEQAISYGETPVNTKACPIMETISKGSCETYHANAPAAYFDSIKFWKTPVQACGNGQSDCEDYTTWQQKWTEVTG